MSTPRVEKAMTELKETQRTLNEVIAKTGMGKDYQAISNDIWRAFAKIEYAVLLLKLHLRVENPGQLLKGPVITEDLDEELVKSADLVTRAVLDIEQERVQEALLYARQGRDILKEILLVIRKAQRAG